MDKILEESFLEMIENEISQDHLKPDLMAKAIAQSGGDKELAKDLYIKLRMAQLKAPYEEKEKKIHKEDVNIIEGLSILVVGLLGIYTISLLIKYFFGKH